MTGYRIFRNGVQAGTSTQTTYTDRGLTANTAYTYTVSAHDAAGNSSAHSQPLSITTNADRVAAAVGRHDWRQLLDRFQLDGESNLRRRTLASCEQSMDECADHRRCRLRNEQRHRRLRRFVCAAIRFRTRSDGRSRGVSRYEPEPVSTHEVELLLRISDDSGNARGYECMFDYGAASDREVERRAGQFPLVPLLQSGYLGRQLVTGDVLKATIVGNTITMYVNGMLMAKGIDRRSAADSPVSVSSSDRTAATSCSG